MSKKTIKYNAEALRWELLDAEGVVLSYAVGAPTNNPWDLTWNNGVSLSAGGTVDATALAKDLLEGVTAYARGRKLTGTIKEAMVTVDGDKLTISSGHVKKETVYSIGSGSDTTITYGYINSDGMFQGLDLTGTEPVNAGTPETVDSVMYDIPVDEPIYFDPTTGESSDVRKGVTVVLNGIVTEGSMPDSTTSVSGNVVAISAGYTPTKEVTIGDALGTSEYTPNFGESIVIPAGKFLTGPQTIKAPEANVEDPASVEVNGNIVTITGGLITSQTVTVGEALGAQTYNNIADGDVVIPAGKYLTGAQTIKAPSAAQVTKNNNVVSITAGLITKQDITVGTALARKEYTPGTSSITIPAGSYLTGDQVIKAVSQGYVYREGNMVYVSEGYVQNDQFEVGTALFQNVYTPGTTDQVIGAGQYLMDSQIIKGDANLISENIKAGVSIFNVEGSFEGSGSDSDETPSPVDPDYAKYIPLTFTALEDGATLALNTAGSPDTSGIQYRTSEDEEWASYTFSGNSGAIITLAKTGDWVQFRNTNTSFSTSSGSYFKFSMPGSGNIIGSGNLMSLFNYSDSVPDYGMNYLFQSCSGLYQAPEIYCTTVGTDGMRSTFQSCSNLVKTMRSLPATSVGTQGYLSMFNGCQSLEDAGMTIKATSMGGDCMMYMFMNNSNLTVAPVEMPSITANWCFYQMFMGCSSLVEGPTLNATSLAASCYKQMFKNCYSLESLKVGFTSWGDSSCTSEWVSGVNTDGTFYCPAGLSVEYGINRIPSDWTVSSAGDESDSGSSDGTDIIVSGAGTSAVNGTYKLQSGNVDDHTGRWSNGTYTLAYGAEYWCITTALDSLASSPWAHEYFYDGTSTDPTSGAWYAGSGSSPAPTLEWAGSGSGDSGSDTPDDDVVATAEDLVVSNCGIESYNGVYKIQTPGSTGTSRVWIHTSGNSTIYWSGGFWAWHLCEVPNDNGDENDFVNYSESDPTATWSHYMGQGITPPTVTYGGGSGDSSEDSSSSGGAAVSVDYTKVSQFKFAGFSPAVDGDGFESVFMASTYYRRTDLSNYSYIWADTADSGYNKNLYWNSSQSRWEISMSGPGTVWYTTESNPFTAKSWKHYGGETVSISFKDIVTASTQPCFMAGTPITLADGTTKAVEDITYDDELLVYNFDEGKLDTAKPAWIMQTQYADSYQQNTFSDGTVLNTVGAPGTMQAHRMFSVDQQKFVYMGEAVGDTAYTLDGECQLVSSVIVNQPCEYHNIITKEHFNLFANGVLTSNRFSNMYPIKDMRYVKTAKAVQEYPGIPEDMVKDFRLAEQSVDVEYIERLIELKK